MEELKEWGKIIESFEKLSFEEAKRLYKLAIETNDPNLEKEYINRIIQGTLYVVYNYIKRNHLELFESSSCDMNDIINQFNESWIRIIRDGGLLRVDRFSILFRATLYNDVCNHLIPDKIEVYEQFGISSDELSEIVLEYIECKHQNGEPNVEEIIQKHCPRQYYYFFERRPQLAFIKSLLDKIYQSLNWNKQNKNLCQTKVRDYLRLIISLGMTDYISDISKENYSVEDTIIRRKVLNDFVRDVDAVIENQRNREILHKRYGLDDGKRQTSQSVAEDYNVSIPRVQQIEGKLLQKLRCNKKIREYKGII